jgi:hypothetical protein
MEMATAIPLGLNDWAPEFEFLTHFRGGDIVMRNICDYD